jgi:putative ABC transport system permease protein
MIAALLQELRFAIRALARSPWFTATCVAMLAAGLGLSMYMFGAINGFVLKPLPFMDAERIMFVAYQDPDDADDELGVPLHDFIEIRAAQTQFDDLAGWYDGTINLSDGERPERYDGVFATSGLFTQLGIQPQLGRLITDDDTRPGAAPVAVIGHALWINRFGGDPKVLGKPVRINGKPSTIVGVLPPGFRFPRKHDVYVPLPLDTSTETRANATSIEAFGRLRDGATEASARAELDAQIALINAAHPEARRSDRSRVMPYGLELINPQTRTVLYTMFAAVLMVLLIACANVANLMVARGAARQRELAIRGALGAGRRRLVTQVLAESLLISAAAAALGLVGAIIGGEITMQAIMSAEDPPVYWVDFSLDGVGVAFSLAVAVLSAVVAALLPAREAARTPAAQAMRAGGAGSIGRGARLGRVLVVFEVAVCMALLVGAGLTVRSVLKMQNYDLGVDVERVLTGRIGLFEAAYPEAADRVRFIEALESKLAAIPGVESAALATSLPVMDMGRYAYQVEGREVPADNNYPDSWATWVTPSYFDTFRFRPIAGRAIDATDRADSVPVAMVNESFARATWPDESPLGKRIKVSPTDPESPWATVVGVLPDTVQGALVYPQREAVFLPLAQAPAAFLSFAVKTRNDPYAMSDAVRAAVTSVDADLPIYWLRSMDDWIDIAMWDGRLMMRLFGVFAGFALLLAVSGIYAVLAYAVSQRTREIGVRRALGARDPGILRMVLGQGGRQLAIGLAIGVVLALGFGRLLANILFDLPAFDPLTFFSVAAILALVSALAGWIPARRALRVPPMVALRYE